MSSGPRTVEGEIIFCAGATLYNGYMDGPGGGKTSSRLDAYWGTGVSGRWPLLGSLRTRSLAILTDRLGWRGGLFLEWASAAFRDGERGKRGELPEDNSVTPHSRGSVDYPSTRGIQVDVGLPDTTFRKSGRVSLVRRALPTYSTYIYLSPTTIT